MAQVMSQPLALLLLAVSLLLHIWVSPCMGALDSTDEDETYADPDMFFSSGGSTENLLGYIGLSSPTGSNNWVKHDTHLAFSMAYNDSKALLYPYRIAVVYFDSGECSLPMAVESMLDAAGHVNLRGDGSAPPFLAFLGGWCRATTKALTLFTSTFGIPQITYGPMMDSVDSNVQSSSLFHMYPSAREESLFLVTLVEWFGWTSVAILAAADQYSQALSTFIRDHLANLDDVQLVLRQVYTDSVELDRAMTVIRQIDPADVTIVLSEDCDEVVMAAQAAGLVERSRLWLTNRDCLLNANASTRAFLNATLFTSPVFYGNEGDEFISRFSKIRGAKPGDMSAAYVYDAAMAVFSIIAMAAKLGVSLNGDEVTARLRKVAFLGVTGKVSFNQYGERINTLSNLYTQRLTPHIASPLDGSRVLLPATTPMFNSTTSITLLQTQRVGRVVYDGENSLRIVLDNGNSVTGLWSFITGKDPLGGGGPGTHHTRTESEENDIGSIPWIWAVLGVSVTIVFVAGVFVCRRLYRFMLQREKLKQQSSARIAAECIAAIPRLNVDAVEWIHTIEQPDPVQIGFIRMVQVIKNVRPFITDALRQLLSEDDPDDEASLIEQIRSGVGGGSRSDTSKLPSLSSLDRSCVSTLESVTDPVRRMHIICGKPSASSILSDSVWLCRTVVVLVARFEFPFAFHGMEQTYVSAIRAMVSAIKAHRGTIEYLSAYCLIAHWGAVRQMSHSQAAKKACDAAVQLHESLANISEGTRCHIGLAMGECRAGTFADPQFGAFLVIGRPMSLAWKLSEPKLHQKLGTRTLVNRKLQKQIRDYPYSVFRRWGIRLIHILVDDDDVNSTTFVGHGGGIKRKHPIYELFQYEEDDPGDVLERSGSGGRWHPGRDSLDGVVDEDASSSVMPAEENEARRSSTGIVVRPTDLQRAELSGRRELEAALQAFLDDRNEDAAALLVRFQEVNHNHPMARLQGNAAAVLAQQLGFGTGRPNFGL